jgi:Ran GTPase-activating protein (RanGAP) involved in mRNA processing and transport
MKNNEFYNLIQQIENRSFIGDKVIIHGAGEWEEQSDYIYRLTDSHIHLLVNALKKNPSITSLNLSGNAIKDEGAIALATVSSLKELDISDNEITVKGAEALAKSNLQKLSLQDTSIFYSEYSNEKYRQFESMINALINNKTIIELNLYCLYIPDTLIVKLIGENNTIKTLSISRNLTDEALEGIKENKTLESLYIPENSITDKGIEYICGNSDLKKLTIDKSEITDVGAKLLSNCQTLEELHIFDSNITAEGAMNFIFIGSNLNKFSIDTNIKQNVLPRENCHYIGRLFYEAKEATNCLYMDVEPQSYEDCDMTCEALGFVEESNLD